LLLSNFKSVYLMSGESRERVIEAIRGAYIDNKSNRAVGEKAVRKSNNTG
jgi:hypothetical protein